MNILPLSWRRSISFFLAGGCLALGTDSVRADIFNVNSQATYEAALLDAFTNPTRVDTINVTGSFTMSNVVLPINKTGAGSLAVNGGGNTIDGGGAFRPFFALDGSASISNVTINNARAAGGSGATGGGGGLGAGGGLFVNNGATVSISNVSFSNSSAVGGAGAATTGSVAGGGGGGLGGNGAAPSGAFEGGGGGGGLT